MSIFDDALVTVVLADYIGADVTGKLNVVGQGFQFTAVQPTGNSNGMYVAALVDIPPRYVGDQVAITLELFDIKGGGAFTMPNQAGKRDALRVEQLHQIGRPQVAAPAGFLAPSEITCRMTMLAGFPGGLPVTPGGRYEWRVSVDHQRRKGWVARFDVLEPAPPTIIGGHGGPADIPNVVTPTTDDDDVVSDG